MRTVVVKEIQPELEFICLTLGLEFISLSAYNEDVWLRHRLTHLQSVRVKTSESKRGEYLESHGIKFCLPLPFHGIYRSRASSGFITASAS